MWQWSFILLSVVIAASGSKSSKPEWWEVKIAQGPVRGQWDPNRDVYIFYNIPYATAPTGEHKFKAPLPPPTWTEPYDAIDKKIICPQYPDFSGVPKNLNMQENCLIANVYVPDIDKKNLSVMVYVHGGAFQIGYGDWYKPTKLMESKDLIVVTFNYRLGIHGFLCLGTKDAPGNAGMKDQVTLLRWVQKNIAAFGGNPHDVTITGCSAGGSSVDLLMLVKSTEGLFHKVIPQSGVSLSVFTIQGDPLQNAKTHAKTLNFTNTGDIFALENVYKSLPYDILTADLFGNRTESTFLFSPCVKRDMGDEVFLVESPFSIIKKGNYKKLPLLFGFTRADGLMRLNLFEVWKDSMNKKFSDFLPADLKFETEDEREEIAKSVKTFYFGDKMINNDDILKYTDYFTDVMFAYSTLKVINLYVKAGHNEIYLYEYSFVDDDTPVVPYTNVRAAGHCAQSFAILDDENVSEDKISEEFKTMKRILREIWRNFAKTGKPVPEGSVLPQWPAVGKDGSPYMSLGQKLELGDFISEKRFLFWDDIYENYYQEPIPPPEIPNSITDL